MAELVLDQGSKTEIFWKRQSVKEPFLLFTQRVPSQRWVGRRIKNELIVLDDSIFFFFFAA